MAEETHVDVHGHIRTRLSIIASRWIFLICSCIPWINLVTFLLYAGYVRQGLGHWPRPMSETVRLPYRDLFETVTGATLLATVVSIPLWFILLALRAGLGQKKWTLPALFLFGSGFLATWLCFLGDKGRFFDWWID